MIIFFILTKIKFLYKFENMAKKKEENTRPETYEKSNLKIKGTFEQVIQASFIKDKKPKQGK
jgi:hypothetical protein